VGIDLPVKEMTTMWRAFLSFVFAILFIGVLAGIGTQVYQAGVAQGIVDAGRFPAGATVPVVGGYHGFNALGLLFPLLFLFILFGLIRAAFWGGRGWGHGRGHHGWDRGWDRHDDPDSGRASWREQRDRRMAEVHRRLHESEGSDPGAGSGGPTGVQSGAPGR
jgi:hypothetical protein